ncbi:KAT8 regulatory NSL complex subunit 3 [Strongyloides ratti]|uniref:KAT8 regulatory NSL complex subunit 3 n=1 Tax=Strongyloides ratti TaxID=34506 RepID=A0A090MSL7_STRRB|nr:KAT8 regulatory NSL complex subunit 3 [Strongyloides ratti]CEF61258.1 KAT8 regulatory NSL complex subunit 3 [Strongyloides ratti]
MVKKKATKVDISSNNVTTIVNTEATTEEPPDDNPNIRRSSRTRRATATILTSDLSLPSFNSSSFCRDSISINDEGTPLPKKRRISESSVKRARKKSLGNTTVISEEPTVSSDNNQKLTEDNKIVLLEPQVSEETIKTDNLEDNSITSETGRGKRMKKPKKFADEEIIESSSRKKSICKPKNLTAIKNDQSVNEDKTQVAINNVEKQLKVDVFKCKSTDLSGEEDVKVNSVKRKTTKLKSKNDEDDERELSMVESADYNIISLSSKVGNLNFGNGFSMLDRLNSVKQMKIQRENEKRLEALRKEQEKKERAEKRKQELQKKRQEQKLLSLQAQNTYFPGFNIFMPNSVDISHDNTPDPDYTMDELFVTNSGRVVKNRNNYLRNRYDQCLFVDDKNPDLTYDPNYEEEDRKSKKDTKQKLYEQPTVSRKFFGRGISTFFPLHDDENETTSQEEGEDDEEIEEVNTTIPEIVKSTSTPTEDGFVINIDGDKKKRRIKFVVNRYKLQSINNKELRESMKVDVRLKLREERLPFKSKFRAIELNDRNWPGNYNVGILLDDCTTSNNDEDNDLDICVDDDLENPIYHKTTYDAFVKELPGKQVVDDIRQIEANVSPENIMLESIIAGIDKYDLKYMIEKGLQIIKQQFYSETTYLNVDNSASVFHVFSRRNADLLLYYMSPYSRKSRELAHKAHLWFMQYLPDNLLAAYLNILRFAKSFGYKVSDILKENNDINFNHNDNQKSEEIKKCIKDFINVKAVDPWYKEAKDALPTSISNVTCFIVLPNISTYDYCPVNVMHKELMENFIPSIGSHTEFVNLCFKTPEPVSVAELMEHCIDKVKIQLQSLLASRPNDHIITVGWGVTNAIIHRVLSEIGGVSASINLAYCNKTADGIIGDVDHEITLSYCPQLFIVGENSTMFDIKYFNITRQTMTCETGLVVVGNGDSNLRVSANTLIRERVTQSSVNLIITEVVKDFIEAVTPFDDIPIKEFRKIMQPTDMDLHLEVDCQLLKENHTILYSAQALKKANESRTFKGNVKIDTTRPESPIGVIMMSTANIVKTVNTHTVMGRPKPKTINNVPTTNESIFTSENSFKETSTFEERKSESETSLNNASAIDLGDLDIGGFGSFF